GGEMLAEPELHENAAWRRRFRAPVVGWTQIARSAPERGLAMSNRSGVSQLYAWDVATGELRQLTQTPEGRISGLLSSDGRYVYYPQDAKGNELGHYVRLPFEGGEPQDVTPGLPPYASWNLSVSQAGNRIGFIGADAAGLRLYCLEQRGDGSLGEPREIDRTAHETFGLQLSHGGEMPVIGTTEAMRGMTSRLLAFDTRTGEPVGELREGPEVGFAACHFSPIPGDFRLLATSNESGDNRPLLWNAR